jgi:hypothetical protein
MYGQMDMQVEGTSDPIVSIEDAKHRGEEPRWLVSLASLGGQKMTR